MKPRELTENERKAINRERREICDAADAAFGKTRHNALRHEIVDAPYGDACRDDNVPETGEQPPTMCTAADEYDLL